MAFDPVDTPFSHATRAENIAAIAQGPLDLLVIGAGITGTGIARDAAMRGLRTAIIDKSDFASGTSSRSSRLVHGGLRYLEMWHFRLVFEASRERRTLLRIAPHLVRPLPFIFPVHAGARVPLWKLAAGLMLYDVLSMFRNVRRHRMMGKQGILRLEPSLRSHDLKGGGLYYDAQCHDARLTLATVRSAHRHGALAANYVGVDDFERADGRIYGARITDHIGNATYSVRAKVIVNATGPWSDETRSQESGEKALQKSKGTHVVVSRKRLDINHAITLVSPVDGRVMFAIPWQELCYIGTTDTDDHTDPERTRATADDVIYLLRSANAFFPAARLAPEDVISTWAGIRPLITDPESSNPSAISREHRIIEDESGLISIVGGKLTTYRSMGAEVVDAVGKRIMELEGRRIARKSGTDREPLPGGEVSDLEVMSTELIRQGFSRPTAEHLVRTYGTESAAIVRIVETDPAWGLPIVGGHHAIRAELVHAVRREMAVTLNDIMLRRTNLFFEVMGHALPETPMIVDLIGDELGWDASRKAAELASYLEHIGHGMRFRDKLES